MQQKLRGRAMLAENVSMFLLSVSLVFGCAGCDEDYRTQTEPFYEALARLQQDVSTNVSTQTFADDLAAADKVHEQWVQRIGQRGLNRRSAREMASCLQIYGRAGTLRILDGTEKIVDSDVDRIAYAHARQTLDQARYDILGDR
ncbi:MAG TPA: hypothetical protein VFW23_17365 [Tepidisphaeraceae bacterium]|nr:hypothetical protein [Tepidisphaeraceae bacterium]